MFDLNSYYSHLTTISLGRPCIYMDQIESTINHASKQPSGAIVVAGRQTHGKGQRNNVWHSPVGCAMGSLKLVCSKTSHLGKRLSFLQHIIGLSALRTMEEIDRDKLGHSSIKLKWPNDIIYVNPRDKIKYKIGGVLVNSNESDNLFDLVLSFGLNVHNSEPTSCISKIAPSKLVSTAQVIAQIMNHLEEYTSDLNDTKFQSVKQEYIYRCLNIDDYVEDEIHGVVKIKDVNDDGYLVGERLVDKQVCNVIRIVKQTVT